MIAILLAGGRSARMGRDKPLIELNSETLVERHLRQLGRVESLVVCNGANEPAIRERTGARCVRQEGHDMPAAVLTGLRAAGAVETAWLVCVNDIVADDDYGQIAQAGGDIVIPTRPLERTFEGGYLEIGEGRVRRIVEKPPGGCPPGAAANIMIHRWNGLKRLARLQERLAAGVEYESAVNEAIGEGAVAVPVPVRYWRALKTPEDLASVEAAMRRGEVA